MSVSLRIEEDQAGSLLVRAEGELTVQHAAEFRTCLLDALGRAQSIRVDLQAIEDMDLTCLQLLCSAHKTALSAGRELSLDYDGSDLLERSIGRGGFFRSRGCALDQNDCCLWIQRR